jgi:hypothetical protein
MVGPSLRDPAPPGHRSADRPQIRCHASLSGAYTPSWSTVASPPPNLLL